MNNDNKDKAKELLVHYFEIAIESFDNDEASEVRKIIDCIFDEIKKNKCNCNQQVDIKNINTLSTDTDTIDEFRKDNRGQEVLKYFSDEHVRTLEIFDHIREINLLYDEAKKDKENIENRRQLEREIVDLKILLDIEVGYRQNKIFAERIEKFKMKCEGK